jgi:hypothetical protein
VPITPQADDVIIHRQIHYPATYILSRQSGSLQASYKSYEAARVAALGFVLKHHLDAWYTTDEQTFERIAQHRSAGR